MSDPLWLTYAGAITGVIGVLTGIAGAVMGYVSYRRSTEIKSLDLRLELRKAVSDLSDEVQDLQGNLSNAKKSRLAVSAATGMRSSGALDRWLQQHASDLRTLESLEQGLAELNVDHTNSSYRQLESKLVEVHALRSTATRLHDRCVADLAADDRERDRIREDVRPRIQSNLG